MTNTVEIDFENIDKRLFTHCNIIYGAGMNGRLLCEKFEGYGVKTAFFYDDDHTRWGEDYCGSRILSKEELIRKCSEDDVNIIISSMYVGQIKDKLADMSLNCACFTVLGLLIEKDSKDLNMADYKGNPGLMEKAEKLKGLFDDELSKRYFDIIKQTIAGGKALPEMVSLYCGQEQYFLDAFRDGLNGMTFVDAGAYTGDTVRKMKELSIMPKKVYCFEADDDNYVKLLNYMESDPYAKERIIPVNKALWNRAETLSMKNERYNARISGAEEADRKVEAVDLDSFLKAEGTEKIDFIKMDIEGAERYALKGAEQTILSDRPVLAISIYHSMEDTVDIPLMLINELKDYVFLVRHHSYSYSETILYCIPRERDHLIKGSAK
ncbi:MAG: FkbM family methyltransferase [Lachnospiraceae bacterium]|nr:FkbM family methyltransferase [Lachnospiraceae bacterium]